jgi:hypothetical protein
MKRIMLAALMLLGLNLTAFAQGFTGTVSGRVLDQQQAAVANATVILKNEATAVERRTATDGEGDYVFNAVAPGKYSLRGEAANFEARSVNIEVTVATSLRADITLGIRGATEAVTVSATGEGGVAVQTEQATLGNTINQRQVVELPTLTRNPYDFIALSAGAAPSSDGRGAGFAVNGQRSASGNFILDGGENNDTFIAGVAQAIPLDAVQEFRVQTNNYTAEYGRNAGFIANVVSKSGANQMHGSVYWFNRNSAFAANTFENNATGNNRPVFNRNQFGGAVGGPIIKDKLFYFGSFEPIIIRSSAPVNFFVPTPQLLAISSPATRAIFQRFPVPANISTTNVRNRTVCPFANFVPSATNPATGTCNVAPVTIPALAQTTATGPRDAGAGDPQDAFLSTGRIDYNVNEKTQLFGRYAFEDRDFFPTLNQPYSTSLQVPNKVRNQNMLLNLTRTWSGSFVTESRVVYNRVLTANPLTPDQNGFPAFNIIGEAESLPVGSSAFGGPQNLYQFFQTANWTKGSHNMKFGGQYVQLRDNRTFGAYQTADAQFSNLQNFVNGNLTRYTIAIDPRGAFPGQTINPPFVAPSFTRHFRYNEVGVFFQDTWKIHPRVTLTPGLRYEYFGVLHSPGHEKSLDANFYYGDGRNIYERIANGRFLRTIDAPGKYKGQFYLQDWNDFGPRLGIAWDVFGDGKTSFRAGYGMFYDRNFGNVLFNAIQNPPNYGTTFITNVPVASVLTNQYGAFGTASRTLSGSSARHLDQDLRTAFTHSWNSSLEHEFANKYILGATYIGSVGNKLYSLSNINRIGSARLINPSLAGRLNTNASSINTRGNLGRSNYNALQLKADSRYIDKIGLQFGANYTFSRSNDNNSSFFGDDAAAVPIGFGFLDAFNTQLDKGPSDFDIRHRFVGNFVWDIPFGKNSSNFVGKYLVGGWQMNGIVAYRTGAPFGIFDSSVGDYSVEQPRPILAGPLPTAVGSRSRPDAAVPNLFLYIPVNIAFDLNTGDCLTNAAPFRCGASVNGPFNSTVPRNVFRRPGNITHNISFLKNIQIREGMKLQIRSEFYNIFNHPNEFVVAGSNDIANFAFNQNATTSVPGITSFFDGNRQIVMALKLIF